jgi:phosphate:Na+ symporter
LRLKLEDTQQHMTDEGIRDIQHLHDMVAEYIRMVAEAVEREDRTPEFFAEARAKGSAITRIMKDNRSKHLERVGQGIATPLKSLIYTDMLTSYRRIKDHAFNIAEVLIGEK